VVRESCGKKARRETAVKYKTSVASSGGLIMAVQQFSRHAAVATHAVVL